MGNRRPVFAALLAAAFAVGGPVSAEPEDDAVAVIDGLMWTVVGNGENVPWSEADEYCETLEIAGFDDWRLPTLVELETLYDPASETRVPLRNPIELNDCCAWSSMNLVDLAPESKGELPEPRDGPTDYYWGFLFAGGIRYYSLARFPDGEALCVREPGEQ